MIKKIAFLFLTRDNPNFINIWNLYFNGYENLYNIYIHPKNPDLVTWNKNKIIKNLQQTEWGFITRAYIELLKEAYKNKSNYKFITISESCIPIKSFIEFYNDVINDERSWIKFLKISRYDLEERINKQPKINKPKHFIKHYARFCLNRSHVKTLLSKNLTFFHNMHVGDEFFLSALYPIKNVKNFDVTYDDWDYVKEQVKKLKEKKRKLYEKQELTKTDLSNELKILTDKINDISKNPKTIIKVKNDLQKIKKCESYFYRKFAKNSDIEKYWNKIIY